MRIAINARFLIKDKLEGIGWYTYEICKRMVNNHPEDEFLFIHDRAPDPSFQFGPNVKNISIGLPARHPILWYLWFEWSIPRALKKWKPDVFLSPDGFTSLRYKGKKVTVMHDLGFEHFPEHVPIFVRNFYQNFSPKYTQSSDHVIAVSEATKKDIHDLYHKPLDDITVAYNGCRKGFRPHSQEEIGRIKNEVSSDSPYFIFVGALHPRKNVTRLLQAFDLFAEKRPEYKLMITGRKAWMTGNLSAAFDNMKHGNRVIFTGYLDQHDLIKATAAAYACVYPSLFEGFGVPMLEAMHSGVPVIASNVSCMPEIVGDAGLMVDPFSVPSIADGMEKLVSNDTLKNQMINKGLERAKEFSWSASSNIIYKVFTKITSL